MGSCYQASLPTVPEIHSLQHESLKDVITFSRIIGNQQMVHPTEKPVGLLSNLISSVTKPGDLILDPFAGSGSTLVAAKKTGRRFIGVELDDEYFAIAQRRIEEAVTE